MRRLAILLLFATGCGTAYRCPLDRITVRVRECWQCGVRYNECGGTHHHVCKWSNKQ